jgi:hypothetical protein
MKRINIFGSSEKLNELGEAAINRLLNLKTPSLGLNHFPLHYPNVDYWLFSDQSMVEKIQEQNAYKDQKIITNQHIYKNMLTNKGWEVEEIFEPNDIQGSIGNSGWYACWWAIQKGFTHLYLYGILDGNYSELASGDTAYIDIFTEEKRFFQDKKYQKFKADVENNFGGVIKICRPLAQFTAAATESIN